MLLIFCAGSSPRLRGTEPRGLRVFFPGRFIPAPAGNSLSWRFSEPLLPVHPRACGGTVASILEEIFIRRFIPAPAGNRNSHGSPSSPPPVHPRACGEQLTSRLLKDGPGGSSPRLRGNRRATACWVRPKSVHPRACGEQTSGRRLRIARSGSSPRLRGTGVFVFPCEVPARFIPAPAGNRRQARFEPTPGSVHPRACGEQWNRDVEINPPAGSSPRLRGTDSQ